MAGLFFTGTGLCVFVGVGANHGQIGGVLHICVCVFSSFGSGEGDRFVNYVIFT